MADNRPHSWTIIEESDLFELTAAQRGMWFAERLSDRYSVNIAQFLDIEHTQESLDLRILAECLIDACRVLESPYLRMVESGGEVRQVVDQTINHEVDIIDFRGGVDPFAAAYEWMLDEYRRPVDLAHDKLVISALLRVSDERTLWYMRGHHIVIDGYSALTLTRMAVERYNARVTETELVEKPLATMAEVVADEQAYREGSRYAADRAHWLEQVSGSGERVTLSRRGVTAPLDPVNLVSSTILESTVQDRLEQVATDLHSSAAVILTAAFSAFTARRTGLDDVTLTLPVTGRATAKIKRAGGMLANLLPVRATDVTDKSVRELIESMQVTLTGALRHQRYRVEDIRRDAGLHETGATTFGPVVNMMFFDKPIELIGARVEYHILSSGILEDLLVNLYQASPGAPLGVDLHANPGLYEQHELDVLHSRFIAFLHEFLAAGSLDRLVADLPMLTDRDRELLAGLPAPHPTAPTASGHADPSIIGRFRRIVDEHPESVAVVDQYGHRLTYGELADRVDRVARALTKRGVGPRSVVGIATPRRADLISVILGVLSAGAAYLPVDTASPADRLAFIVEDAAPACVILDDEAEAGADAMAGIPAVSLSTLLSEAGAVPLPDAQPLDSLAYIIYTSGSTGRPKPVAVTHRNLIALLDAAGAEVDFAPADVWSFFHSYAFDFSVWEIFGPLSSGARVVIVDRDTARSPHEMRALIERECITFVSLTPSAFAVLADACRLSGLPSSLRHIVFGGEALPFDEVDRWYRTFGDSVKLTNMYGITETTVHVTSRALDPGLVRTESGSMIGAPLPSMAIHLLDRRLQPVAEGAVGEIYVAGEQVARGYRGRPGLTSQRFIANPFGDGDRLYRSGDLGRRVGTDIEYLGRSDLQVQLRGYRIELGEVEAALRACHGVAGAAAKVCSNVADSGPKLVAYVVPDEASGSDLDVARVRAEVRQLLPGYMVPDLVNVIDGLPRTINGKLDRAILPAPVFDRPGHDVVLPTTDTERIVVDAVADVLGTERIGMRDNLFGVGGDSLDAARIVAHLRTTTGKAIGLTDLFDSEDLADFARRIEQVSQPAPSTPTTLDERPETIPLSTAQTRLWFTNRLDQSSAAYNMAGYVELGPEHDPSVLVQAFAAVVDRHETLRTRYPSVDGEPVQEILSADTVVHSVTAPIRQVSDADVDDVVTELAARGFDLAAEVPVRFTVLAKPSGFLALIVLHHITGDGMSLSPLVRDLLTAYDALRTGRDVTFAPLPLQYIDHTIWQRQILGDPDDGNSLARAELDFWRREFAGADEVMELPADRARPDIPSGRGAFVDRLITSTTFDAVTDLAASVNATPFHVMHAALSVLLSRLWGGSDVTVGTAVAGRDDRALADLVGMFVNTVPLRTRITPYKTAREIVEDSKSVSARAIAHSHVPFEQVVEEIAPDRALSHSPLFQVMLTWQHDWLGPDAEQNLGTSVRAVRIPAAKYELQVAFTQSEHAEGPAVDVEFGYATDIFDASTIEMFADEFARVLTAMVRQPDNAVGAIDLLDTEVVTELGTISAAAQPRSFRELLAGAATDRRSSSVALRGDTTVTRELFEARTNQIARELAGLGVGPGDAVAIEIGRSTLSVVATVAVIKSGAAFVLIDPTYPAERRQMMLETIGAAVGVTRSGHRATHQVGMRWLALDDPNLEMQIAGHSGAPLRDDELARQPSLDDDAYLIFTSGSTGKPKATLVSNRQVANLAEAATRRFGVGPQSRVLHVASPSFDVSVLELLLALHSGGELVVAGVDEYAGSALTNVIAKNGVTHAMMTPSVLSTIEPSEVPMLQTVMAAGEACSAELVRRWSSRSFFNAYGPTEATVIVTVDGPMTQDDQVTIGTALSGVGAFVLDDALRHAPAGVTGELYLGGDQVAIGYLHQPALTSTRFVANPYGPGRLYRTGDRVTRRGDGRIVYHGRNDFQIKIRGLRIEPGEVDAVIEEHPSVVTALSAGIPGPARETLLVSYVSIAPGATVSPDNILDFAASRLPRHMIPHTIVIVDRFELTPVGKIDRRALPSVDLSSAEEYLPPRTEMETVIAGVFGDVTGAERVGARDDFFGLGGTSLSAVKVTSRVSEVIGRDVSVRELFAAPTVAELAESLGTSPSGSWAPPLGPRARAEMVAVSTVQRGLWVVNNASPESAAYNIALALRIRGELDEIALRLAVRDVVERHETLRTTYPMINGQPMQLIMPAGATDAHADLRVVAYDGDVEQAIAEVTGRGFDVTSGVPVRWVLLTRRSKQDDAARTAAPDVAGESVLVFVVHHIGCDGASLAPLARDLMAAYAARARGEAPGWDPLELQYADFTLWQQEKLAAVDPSGTSEEQAQLDYWLRRLHGSPERIQLPTDRPRPKSPSFAGGRVEFEIPTELRRSLESVARQSNTTMFMVLHTVFAVLLHRMSGDDDIVIGTPYAGRADRALDDIVGMFVNTLALRTELDPHEDFTRLLERVRRDDLSDMANADISFERIASELLAKPPTAYNPVYQVMFAYQNLDFPALRMDSLEVEPISEELVTAKVDLQLTVFPYSLDGSNNASGAMQGRFDYATDLFEAQSVEKLSELFLSLLREVGGDPQRAVGDIVARTSIVEAAVADDEVDSPLPLSDLVASAAEVGPAETAMTYDGMVVTFADLWSMVSVMTAAMPTGDIDSALTMAVMGALPALAAGGSDALDDVLEQLRANAVRVGRVTMSRESYDQ